jgi:hypothetical protein
MTGAAETPPPIIAPGAPGPPGIGRLAMHPDEAALFRAQLVPPPACYLEWGLGGSTAEALRAGARLAVSVEGDAAWIAAARAAPVIAAAEAQGRLRLLHADIGPTGSWGRPVDRSARPRWPGYAAAPWAVLDAALAWPDLVLVDGRFRVACCLRVAQECLARPDRAAPRLMLHDFHQRRPHYEPMRLAWEEVAAAGSLRLFRLRRDIDPAALAARIGEHAFDPR